ncbi:hypothetical protein [Gordonia paraffinivorans]|nr:hypothetical protein [Gordonia paraffinivorans]
MIKLIHPAWALKPAAGNRSAPLLKRPAGAADLRLRPPPASEG